MITPSSIVNSRQNHPELVVQDCATAFSLSPEQQEELRFILLNRGVNKWLLARRRMIALKHAVKQRLKDAPPKTERHRLLQWVNTELQNIAKAPRWVEWPKRIHGDMKENELRCIERGKRM